MHNSRKVFLLEGDQEPRCILAAYEAGENAPLTEFKTFDHSIEEGDYIIVGSNTRHHMTVSKVVEVDVEVTLDTEAPIEWVVGTIDRTTYLNTIEQEQNFINKVKQSEKEKMKKDLRETMLAGLDASTIAIIEHKPDITPEEPVKIVEPYAHPEADDQPF